MGEKRIGRYVQLEVQGEIYTIYYEEAGAGHPIVCLHTAGADSRQFAHLLEDEEFSEQWRWIAFDLPHHGRSHPAGEWWLKEYRLTTSWYRECVISFIRALNLDQPIVMGCSMGGLITLDLAYRFPEEIGAVIAVEAADKTPGRFNEYLNHPAINTSELCATWTYGLMAPQSPESFRRENWWIYSQGGPGVYYGDIYFYSIDWDGREIVSQIDTKKCPVYMLTGEYDYSCPWPLSEQTANKISGAVFQRMEGIGHFPMIENPPLFKSYLQPYLTEIRKHLS